MLARWEIGGRVKELFDNKIAKVNVVFNELTTNPFDHPVEKIPIQLFGIYIIIIIIPLYPFL